MQDVFEQMSYFCNMFRIRYNTLLTGFWYLKIHLRKEISAKGNFKNLKDLNLIRVDAFISLRMALKMYES